MLIVSGHSVQLKLKKCGEGTIENNQVNTKIEHVSYIDRYEYLNLSTLLHRRLLFELHTASYDSSIADT